MTVRLEMKKMTKAYGSFLANEEVSFSLNEGEVHAIVGENGAGKTTLMKMLYGMEVPTSGEIVLNGKSVLFESPNDAIKKGIGMVHQHFMLYPDLTVAENIVIGNEPRTYGFFQRKKAEELVQAVSKENEITVRPKVKVKDFSVGEQQRIEILKVLYQGADIIILDEPTAVLTPTEVKELLKSIRMLAKQGKSIILITHKLQEVMGVADRITVLRNGKVTGTFKTEETSVKELATFMVGRELKALTKRSMAAGDAYLKVRGLFLQGKHGKPLLNSLDFDVRSGEIVGIAGVSGNGQSELLQALSGLLKIEKGSIIINGNEVSNHDVKEIREAGLAHIPEDRYLWGAAKETSVLDNALMGYQEKNPFNNKGLIQRNAFKSVLEKWVDQFQIKTNSVYEKAANLSGGNIQKVIVARELGHEAPLILAAEPTRGVDIGAMELIHQALLEKRDHGAAILLVSSELTEILALADRILVMYEGQIAGELTREEATEEKLSILMAGGTTNEVNTTNT